MAKFKKSVELEARTVTFQTVDDNGKVAREAVFDLSKVSEDILIRLALHGASQKIGDSYSGAGDEADPVAYAESAIDDTIAQLYAGDWRVSGTGGPRVSDLAKALSRINGKPVEENQTSLAAASDEQKKAMRKHPKVALALAEIAEENAKARKAKLAEAAAKAGDLPI